MLMPIVVFLYFKFFNEQNIKPYLLVKNNVAIEHSVSKYNIERSINRNIIMKRINGLFEKICTKDNIEYADDKASNDKKLRKDIIKHNEHRKEENEKLLNDLINLNYCTSTYTTFKIYEPKERLIFKLPYYPDRIIHHAIMNIMESIWVNIFISHTYSCVKERGITKLNRDLKKCLENNIENTKYCLKLDIKKFYPSINHEILFEIIKRKIKDNKLLILLKDIIESSDGVPIGNYLSQFFANLYLTYFDHWIKEEVKCKFYFRYADDIVILGKTKEELRKILILIKMYLHQVLKLKLKENYQIFEVDKRGIDFIGYKFYHNYILLRKSIKKNIMKLVYSYVNETIDKKYFEIHFRSYFGWCKYCNSKNLLYKIQKLTGIKYTNWVAPYIKISNLCNKIINVIDIDVHNKYFKINFVYNGNSYYTISTNKILYKIIINRTLPTTIKIWKSNNYLRQMNSL